MPLKPAIRTRRAPFIFSLVLHLGLLAFLFAFPGPTEPKIKIEVQLRRSLKNQTAPNKTQERPFVKRTKSTPQSKDTSMQSNSEASKKIESPNDVGGDDLTVLGSTVGIHARYPRLSRLLGENGMVVIGIENSGARVSRTSGFARLDESALAATREALQSGILDEMLSSKNRMQIRFIFKLVDSSSKQSGEQEMNLEP